MGVSQWYVASRRKHGNIKAAGPQLSLAGGATAAQMSEASVGTPAEKTPPEVQLA